jgi:hypothetical protein
MPAFSLPEFERPQPAGTCRLVTPMAAARMAPPPTPDAFLSRRAAKNDPSCRRLPERRRLRESVDLSLTVLIVCLTHVFAFRKTDHSGAGPFGPPSAAQAADKVDR